MPQPLEYNRFVAGGGIHSAKAKRYSLGVAGGGNEAVIALPVGFASFIFSTSLREEKHLSNAFGSNLLGVVFGGALEYTSNIWGLNSLYLPALLLYLLSFLPRKGTTVTAGQ